MTLIVISRFEVFFLCSGDKKITQHLQSLKNHNHCGYVKKIKDQNGILSLSNFNLYIHFEDVCVIHLLVLHVYFFQTVNRVQNGFLIMYKKFL